MGFFNRFIAILLPFIPKSIVWLFSKKYIAGKMIEDGVKQVNILNQIRCRATMDVLGEDIIALAESEKEKKACIQVLETIDKNRLDANLSLKLTSLGLRIDKEVCYQNLKEIVKKAHQLNNFVRIDMEDSTCTDDTLMFYRRIRKEFDNVGTVIQAYLKRSKDDVQQLIEEGIANLRLCKGIYIEPPSIAFQDKNQIRDNFVEMIEMMLASGHYVGIATHDRPVIERSLEVIKKRNVNQSKYEFQMLLGVTEKMRSEIVSEGHYMRVYVPYGEQWYGYCTRRLKENPNIVGHVIRNFFIRG